jgi:hypothetical protein
MRFQRLPACWTRANPLDIGLDRLEEILVNLMAGVPEHQYGGTYQSIGNTNYGVAACRGNQLGLKARRCGQDAADQYAAPSHDRSRQVRHPYGRK